MQNEVNIYSSPLSDIKLGNKNKISNIELIKNYENLFYKNKNGDFFPYLKSFIKNKIDPYNKETFLFILKDLDIPFIEDEWDKLLKRVEEGITKKESVFGKYYTKMHLRSFKDFRFKNSDEINNFNKRKLRKELK